MMNAPVPPVYVDRASQVLRIEHNMCSQLEHLSFISEKVTHVYNPLQYAAEPHANYVRLCLGHGGPVPVLFLGMNPSVGMCQTGVPFGEIAAVRDWMGVSGEVVPPENQNPHRPITGFSYTGKPEVSGSRFWRFWQSRVATANDVFEQAYVHNFCPLAFMSSSRNVPLNKLSLPLRRELEAICWQALVDIIMVLGARTVIGIGRYAQQQASKLIDAGLVDQVHYLLHPSGLNRQANKGWDGEAFEQLTQAGVPLPFPQ
ncbi:single-strand selective monofunctional uracil DNA glycosylase-like [Amphibalanus amphitrite]|uniref:single-strand selective monofunctional uracil DNA glycosylase-like n=1 Tax=Amphibalanus amphitrite TaxID=1232801 RepID=UPI001C9268E9|nr:single-strand selective monofunctional uracil DNA glycosylase-like [Amphibalanus amphitrite]